MQAHWRRTLWSLSETLYNNQVLSETIVEGDEELGGIKKALAHLDEIKHLVVDQTEWLMIKGAESPPNVPYCGFMQCIC